MLSERRHAAIFARLAHEDWRRRGISDDPLRGVDLDAAQMRMHREVGHGVDLGKSDVGVIEALQQLVAAERAEDVADDLVRKRAVTYTLEHVGEARIIRKLWLTEHLCAEFLPFALA